MHGLNGCKQVQIDTWLDCDRRMVSDGSNRKLYLSGFHVFDCSNAAIIKYCARFQLPRPSGRQLVLVQVDVTGNRRKPTNPDVILADRIRVPGDAFRIDVSSFPGK
jgi:hypothetical protein